MDDPATRAEELAALSCPLRLRDYDLPAEGLPDLAVAIAERPASKANPPPATPNAVREVLAAIW